MPAGKVASQLGNFLRSSLKTPGRIVRSTRHSLSGVMNKAIAEGVLGKRAQAKLFGKTRPIAFRKAFGVGTYKKAKRVFETGFERTGRIDKIKQHVTFGGQTTRLGKLSYGATRIFSSLGHPKLMPWAIGAGAVFGAGVGTSRALFDSYREATAPMLTNHPMRRYGPGYNLWGVKSKNGPMPHNNLGSDGSLVFALNKIR